MKTLFLLGSIVILGFVQSAFAMSSDITLTAPITVDTFGKQISNYHIGSQIGVQSILTNHGKSEQKYAYAVQILDRNGETDFLEFSSASMLPNQSFTASQVWIPKSTGQYTVQVFVWDSLASAIPLTNVLNIHITVNW